MDKKGFTLIEVIGVVIILASIVLIITPNINIDKYPNISYLQNNYYQ